MSRRKIIFIAAGVLVAAGAVAAVAQGHRGWRGHGMHDMAGAEDRADMRGRGFWRGSLTQSEHEARTGERFARLDRNSDGAIDATEVEASITERMGERRGRLAERSGGRMSERVIRRFDENRDGKVTREEFDANLRRMFAHMDLNNDGRITDEDLPPMMRGRNALAEGAGTGFGNGRGGHGGPMMGLLRGADANKDGVITLEEAQTRAVAMFAQFDRNRDGTIDTADRDMMRKEMTEYRVKRFIHHFGADKDGKVTREQFDKVAKERFARMDLDNNGTISRDEMPGRGHWGGGGRSRDDGAGEHRGRRGPMTGPDGGPGMGGPGAPGRN